LNNTEKFLTTSYRVSEVTAQNYKPCFTEEELNLPVCKEIVKVIFGPLSKNTVDRRIIKMPEDIKHNINERLHTGEKFSLRLDGTVYVRNIPVNFLCQDLWPRLRLFSDFYFA
jgi:hypothetical protein